MSPTDDPTPADSPDNANPGSDTGPADSEIGDLDPARLMEEASKPISSAAATPPGAWEPPLPEELADLMPGYEILDVLGRGGMGAVYKGVQKSLDREVAIKLLPPELGADPEFEARFKREAKSMAKLNHPNIVQIFDFGQTTAGHHFFVMEFVDGTDLHQMIRAGQLEPEGALNAISQICDALEYAHEEGFVHRDIKPANIFINSKGILKVGDFGLAKLVEGDDGAAVGEQMGLTMSGVAMGTPHYIAPEQMVEGSSVDRRADIYSLGVMFYEMLTGEIPRGAVKAPSQKVKTKTPDKSLDVRLDDVVFKAMESDPGERYQSATDLRTDVDVIRTTEAPATDPVPEAKSASAAPEAKVGRGVPAEPAKDRKSSPAKKAPPKEKGPALVAAVVVGVLLVIGGIIALVSQFSQNEPPGPANAGDGAESGLSAVEGEESVDVMAGIGEGSPVGLWRHKDSYWDVLPDGKVLMWKSGGTPNLRETGENWYASYEDWRMEGSSFHFGPGGPWQLQGGELTGQDTDVEEIVARRTKERAGTEFESVDSFRQWLAGTRWRVSENGKVTGEASFSDSEVKIEFDQPQREDGDFEHPFEIAYPGRIGWVNGKNYRKWLMLSPSRNLLANDTWVWEMLSSDPEDITSASRVEPSATRPLPITLSPPGRLEAMGLTVDSFDGDFLEAASGYDDFVQVVAIPDDGGSWVALRENGEIVALPSAEIEQLVSDVAFIRESRAKGFIFVHRDGSITTTGGVPKAPTDLKPVIDVAGGNGFGLALHSDGTVTFWGDRFEPSEITDEILKNVGSISANRYNAMIVTGNGRFHQLGDEGYQVIAPPTGESFTQVVGGWVGDGKLMSGSGTVFRLDGKPAEMDRQPLVAKAIKYGGGPVLYLFPTGQWHSISKESVLRDALPSFSQDRFVATAQNNEGTSFAIRIVPGSDADSSLTKAVPSGRLRAIGFIADDGKAVPVVQPGESADFVACTARVKGWQALMANRDLVVGWKEHELPAPVGNVALHGLIGRQVVLKKDGTVDTWGNDISQRMGRLEGVRLFDAAHRFAAAVFDDGTAKIWNVMRGEDPQTFQPDFNDAKEVVKVCASNPGVSFLHKDGTMYYCDRSGPRKTGFENERFVDIDDVINGFIGLTDTGLVRGWGDSDRVDIPDSLPKMTAIRGAGRLAAGRTTEGKWIAWSHPDSEVASQEVREKIQAIGDPIDLDLYGDKIAARLVWIEPAQASKPPKLNPQLNGKSWTFTENEGGSQGEIVMTVTPEHVVWKSAERERQQEYEVVGENEIIVRWGDLADRGVRFDFDAGTIEVWRTKKPDDSRVIGRLVSQGMSALETAAAAPSDPIAARLAEIEAKFRERYDPEVAEPHAAAVKRLDGQIVAALQREQQAAAGGGDLDMVLAWKTAVERLQAGKGVPSEAEIAAENPPLKRPEKLLGFYSTYREQLARLEGARDKKAAPLIELWDQAMDLYQQELTRGEDVDGALRIKKLRDTGMSPDGRFSSAEIQVESGVPSPAETPAVDPAAAGAYYQIDYSRSGTLHVVGTVRKKSDREAIAQPTAEQAEDVCFVASAHEDGGRWMAVKSDGTVISPEQNGPEFAVPRGVENPRWLDLGKYAIAVHQNGTVTMWGDAVAEPKHKLRGVVKAESSYANAIALHEDGTVTVWGSMYDEHRYRPDPAWLEGVIDVAAGMNRAWVLKADGTVIGWNVDGDMAAQNPKETDAINGVEEQAYVKMANLRHITGNHRNVIGMDRTGGWRKHTGAGAPGVFQRVVSGYMLELAISDDGRISLHKTPQCLKRFPGIEAALDARKVIWADGAGEGKDPNFTGFLAWIEAK